MGKKAKKRAPGPGRLSAEDTAKLPDRLLDSALFLFSSKGYAGSTMEQIARRANASTKTIYARYPNKPAILSALVKRIVDRNLAAHFARTAADMRGAEPADFIVSLGRQIATGLSTGDGAAIAYLMMSEGRHFPELAAIYKGGVAFGTELFRSAIEEWKNAGLLPALNDLDRSARLCLSMVSDVPRFRSALGDPMTGREIEAHVAFAAHMFLRGCGYGGKGL